MGGGLYVANVDIDGASFDNVPLTIDGVLTRFDNVTFQNMNPAATQLTVSHPGAASAFTFDGLNFLTAPTTRFYVSANDNAADANTLSITFTNATPSSASPYVATSGGAIVTW